VKADKLHLAFDFDDVIADFGGRVIETVNMEYGVNLKIEDVTSWDLNQLLDPIMGEDWWQWWEERDWLWAKASAIPGALGGLRQLHQKGHWIEIVTAKPNWARAGLWEWLGKWKPLVDQVTIGPARPPMNKAEYTDADLLVDDKPQNCEEFMRSGGTAILFNRPHNKSFYSHQIYRANDWKTVIDIITRLEHVL